MRAFKIKADLYIVLMFEVVLYAAIAVIVCVAFYSVLGKSVGRGSDDALGSDEIFGSTTGNDNETSEAEDEDAAFIDASPAQKSGLSAIAQADPGFSPSRFIDGAKSAYSMILEAFASGDRETLQALLTDEVYAVYDAAITAREEQNLTQTTDLGSLKSTQIKEASLVEGVAHIRVLYEADIASALRNEADELVEGDPDVLASISEYWTYVREVKSTDPTWRLSDVEPSEGDELPADPTPDTTA